MKRLNLVLAARGVLAMLVLSVAGVRVQASFAYHPGDLLVGLRLTGGASDITANLGPVTNYLSLPAGTSITVTNLLTNQLASAFTDLNGVIWSIFSTVRTNGNPDFPGGTLWVTAPRADIDVQSDPWVRKSRITQGNAESIIYAIGNNAFLYGNSQPTGPENSSTGVLIPAGDSFSYSSLMTPAGNFQATFQGNVENANPDNFAATALPARSDLYELKPGSGATLNTPGTHVGFFDLKPDGALSFTAAGGSTPVPPPTISAISRNGALSTISFTTVNGATYSLRHTNSAGLSAPVANWTALTGSVAGNGSVQALQDTSTDADRFYVVVAAGAPAGSPPRLENSDSLVVNSR